jgi:hypothetical protein
MITLRSKEENIGAILLLHGTTENYINSGLLTSPGGRTPYLEHRDSNAGKKRANHNNLIVSIFICCRLKPTVAI